MTMPTDVAVEQALEIVNKRGLHARASAKLASVAGDFEARIRVCKDNACVTATSIMGLMMLGAAKGDTIMISAEGSDAVSALAHITALVSGRFGEDQ